MSILIEHGHILALDQGFTQHAPGWVWVVGDRIQAVGGGAAPEEARRMADRVIDATHMAVLPGLVNSHTHLSQTFMRGVGADRPLLDWLRNAIWPLQAAMTPEQMHLASLLGLVENLRCGVTAVNQHHKLPGLGYCEATLTAAQTVGVRVQLARGWADMGAGAQRVDDILADMATLCERWQGAAGGRLTVSFGPMVPWRCSDAAMRRTTEQARVLGVPTHIHVAETQDEIDLLRQRTGLRHVEWLDSLGVLGPDAQLVHCVHVSDAEIDLIAASGATVIHCPTSNMILGSGVAPIAEMARRGVPVALGTDGAASHNCQDLLETAKHAILLSRASNRDALALTAADALRMMTAAGAHVFGRPDLGRIEAGCKADLTIINLNNSRCMPVYRADAAVVYSACGADVDSVLVDGRILLDRGVVTTVDEASLLEECRAAAADLWRALG